MKIHRFLYPYPVEGSTHSLTDSDIVHQITRVLRLEQDETIELFDGEGTVHIAQIRELNKKEVTVEILNTLHKEKPSRKVALFISILKKENTEIAIEKAVEIGAGEIVPIITSRTIKVGIKTERIESIIKEATEQSGRSYMPTFRDTMTFEDALEYGKSHFSRVVIFDPRGTPFFAKEEKSVAVFIGPEGGFTDQELELAREKNCEITSLPTHILRGETAAIIGVYSALL